MSRSRRIAGWSKNLCPSRLGLCDNACQDTYILTADSPDRHRCFTLKRARRVRCPLPPLQAPLPPPSRASSQPSSKPGMTLGRCSCYRPASLGASASSRRCDSNRLRCLARQVLSRGNCMPSPQQAPRMHMAVMSGRDRDESPSGEQARAGLFRSNVQPE